MQHLIQWAPKEWDTAITDGTLIPLHTSGSCRPIKRSEVDQMLKHVARTTGLASDKVSPHSLRAGGATAMYINGLSRETIMKLGRWKSDAVLRYIDRVLGAEEKMTEKMVEKNAKLL